MTASAAAGTHDEVDRNTRDRAFVAEVYHNPAGRVVGEAVTAIFGGRNGGLHRSLSSGRALRGPVSAAANTILVAGDGSEFGELVSCSRKSSAYPALFRPGG
jgi:hypothetical protein